MTWQRVHRCGVVLVAHSTLTAQRLQSYVDRNGLLHYITLQIFKVA